MNAVHILLLSFNLHVNHLQVGQLRVDVLFGGLQHVLLVGNFLFQRRLFTLQRTYFLIRLRGERQRCAKEQYAE